MQTFESILLWAYWTICFHLILLVITVLFVFTWPFDRFRKIPNSALKILGWLVLKPVPTWEFDMEGVSAMKLDKPTLVMANHQSFLDIPLLYLLPWRMKWITKRSMRKIPVLGWMITMTGHIPIDRNSLRSFHAMNQIIDPVQSGIPGMIFPEGTRSRGGSVQPLKRGAFRIAKRHNFQILPVVINGGHRAMPPGSWKFRFHTTFVISVLTPVQPIDFDDETTLKEHVQQLMQSKLAHIKAKYEG